MKFLIVIALFLSVNAQHFPNDKIVAMEKRLIIVEERMESIESNLQELLKIMKPTAPKLNTLKSEDHSDRKMNNSELEERVQVLEFQVTEVQGDVADVETQVTGVQAEQIIQDQRILELETETTELESNVNSLISSDLNIINSINSLNQTLEASVSGLDSRLGELESLEIATELNSLDSRLSELESLDITDSLNNLDSRLNELELEGSVAFRVGLSATNPLIPLQSVVVFDLVHMNPGGGFNSASGEFTVPTGKAGMYYFSVQVVFDDGDSSALSIRHNGDVLCQAYEDLVGSGDFGGSACGAVVELQEGDVMDVYHEFGISDTPVLGVSHRTTFTGFRFAPQ